MEEPPQCLENSGRNMIPFYSDFTTFATQVAWSQTEWPQMVLPEWVSECHSVISNSATPWTIEPMEFSRTEYWSGQPFLSPGDLPNPGMNWGLLHCGWILYQLNYQGSWYEHGDIIFNFWSLSVCCSSDLCICPREGRHSTKQQDSLQWEAVCPGATSCHAALFPNKLRAGLTPTPCGLPVAGLSSSSIWFDIYYLKPNTYDSAKLNEKKTVTIREGTQFWRPELWKVTVLGAFLVCHGWCCHYRQQQCSHYFWAGLIVQQTPRAMSMQFSKHPVALPLYPCFIYFFPEEMTTDWKNYSRSLIHFRHHAFPPLFIYSFIQYLSSTYYTWIFPGGSDGKASAYSAYHVGEPTLDLSHRQTCALPSGCHWHFTAEGPTIGQSDQRRFLKGCEIETETQRMKIVIPAANKRLFQVEGQNPLRPGWLCKTV